MFCFLFFLQTSKVIHEACKRLAYWPAVLSICSNYALWLYKCKAYTNVAQSEW